jgi:hypothetical protein
MDPPTIAMGEIVEEKSIGAFMEANGLTNGSPIVCCGEFTNEFVIFPGTRQGWNYLWNKNRGRGMVCHYFWILCFTKTADQAGKMQCIGSTLVPTNSRFVAPKGKQPLQQRQGV